MTWLWRLILGLLGAAGRAQQVAADTAATAHTLEGERDALIAAPTTVDQVAKDAKEGRF